MTWFCDARIRRLRLVSQPIALSLSICSCFVLFGGKVVVWVIPLSSDLLVDVVIVDGHDHYLAGLTSQPVCSPAYLVRCVRTLRETCWAQPGMASEQSRSCFRAGHRSLLQQPGRAVSCGQNEVLCQERAVGLRA